MLIVYDEHGGIYDHVVPPGCESDGYSAPGKRMGPLSVAATGPALPWTSLFFTGLTHHKNGDSSCQRNRSEGVGGLEAVSHHRHAGNRGALAQGRIPFVLEAGLQSQEAHRETTDIEGSSGIDLPNGR